MINSLDFFCFILATSQKIILFTNLTNGTSESTAKDRNFFFQYRWIFIICIFFNLLISITIIIIVSNTSNETLDSEPVVAERIQIRSMNLSQHFYEEPVSIIFTPPIDISVYDHVRDNYV